METKFRNHISIVIERFGTIFIGIVIVLAGSALDDLKEIVKHMDNLKEHLADEIHGVTVRQTWIARIFKRYRVELINVGMEDDDEEKDAFFLLYQSHADVIEKMQKLLPEFAEAMGLPLQRQKKSVIFLKAIPAVIWAIALFVADQFAKEIIGSHFLWINLACVCGWLVVLVMLAGGYVTDAFACDKKSLAVSSGIFGRETTYMHYPQIQYFSFNQNIVAKKLRVVKGNAYLLASASDSRHDLPYMPEEVVEELKEYF